LEAGAPMLVERDNLAVEHEVALAQIFQRKHEVPEL
jgi:hypothetical protein